VTIRFPAHPHTGMPYQSVNGDEVERGVPSDRPPVVRRETEEERGFRLAAWTRDAHRSQQLAGSHTVSRTMRGSWEPQPAAVPADQWWEGQRQRGEPIDWQAHEHGEPPPTPDEITVERIDPFEAKALRLSAAIDEWKKANMPPGR
jgi:hypothetical protein